MGKTRLALESIEISEAVKTALVEFFKSLHREIPEINSNTDLISDTGSCSDEGVDFAIDLSDVLDADVPNDFNPFVHESGRRGMKFSELVGHAQKFVSIAKEARDGE
jgi:hypothetical protein